jgi:2-methylcitrate dehydratase PrpD
MTTLQDWLADTSTDPALDTGPHLDTAARAVRDLGGVAVAGSATTAADRVHAYLAATAAPGPAAVLGTALRVDPVSAALANGTAAQALDYDDIAPSCVSHVSAIMVPALAALGDRVAPGRALHGYVRGLMVIDRLAEAFTHEVYDRGIQPTHAMGSIGAVTALLWATGSDRATAHAAHGMLATQIIGLRAHTGTRYKPVQAGMVAAAAVRSVLLARAGLTAGADALDVVMKLLGITGDQLAHLTRPGPLAPVALAAKWYPTCGAAHTAIEATLELRRRRGEAGGDPRARLRVASPPRVLDALAFPRPTGPDEARFSMPYCLATAWLRGRVAPEDFTPEAVASPDVTAFLDQVEAVPDDSLTPPPTWSGFPAVVTVDGTETARVERPLGYPERPLTEDQLADKFHRCVSPVLGAGEADEAWAALTGPAVLERLGRVLAPR